MTLVDIVAVIAAGLASLVLGMRSELLKPAVAKFHTAPIGVVLALAGLSIAMAAVVVSIWWGGGHASVREAWVYSAIAAAGVILFWNVHRQRAPTTAVPPAPRLQGSEDAERLRTQVRMGVRDMESRERNRRFDAQARLR